MEISLFNSWDRLASDIEKTVNEAHTQFAVLPEKATELRPSSGEWSAKEVIGHLIDSASNNHQRFVRLQLTDNLVFPNYGADNVSWVKIQHYQDTPWIDLLSLWRYFNLHLAQIIRTVDLSSIEHRWMQDENSSVTLGEIMVDYLRHLAAHLDQIKEYIDNEV